MPSPASSRMVGEHLAGELGVQRRGDLVEEQELRVAHERAGDGDTLLLAAGELLGVLACLVAQAEPFEDRLRPFLGLGAAARRRPCAAPASRCR